MIFHAYDHIRFQNKYNDFDPLSKLFLFCKFDVEVVGLVKLGSRYRSVLAA